MSEPMPPAPPPPPSPYTPPPPGGGGSSEGPRLPWEERDQLGFLNALIETAKLLVTSPSDAFSRIRKDEDYIWPLAFGLAVSWVGNIFYQIWNLLFGAAMMSMMGGMADLEQFGMMGGTNLVTTIISIIVYPIFYAIGIFISAGIYHLCLMLVGAVAESPTGFEGTLKVSAYSSIADLANVVPIFGIFIAIIAKIVLTVIGFTQVHKTTTGKAVAAVLIPLAVCCICLIIFFVSIAGMIGMSS
ncbi:MAG: hypothetical protein GY719_02665 [bacterium]|nr:hypothetical protein [bacterium]